jgi:hypothetical protein
MTSAIDTPAADTHDLSLATNRLWVELGTGS